MCENVTSRARSDLTVVCLLRVAFGKFHIMSKCKVPSCQKVHKKDQDVSFHMFPRNALLREAWKSFCGLSEGDLITNSARLCSLHFTNDCFPIRYIVQMGLKKQESLSYNG